MAQEIVEQNPHLMAREDDGKSRYRSFVFTINNYTEEDERRLQAVSHRFKHLIYGREEAPTTGTPHLQGHVDEHNNQTLRAYIKMMSQIIGRPLDYGAAMYATCGCCSVYCSKSGNFFESGKRMVDPGKREKEDWQQIYDMTISGRRSELPPRVQIMYHRSLLALEIEHRPPAEDLPWGTRTGLWLHGRTGTGKSSLARLISKAVSGQKPYLLDLNQWWDGYNVGQRVVLIEEWDPEVRGLTAQLKKWTDVFAITPQYKGGRHSEIRPTKIVITSNYTMKECFPDQRDLEALERRFIQKEMTTPWHLMSAEQRVTLANEIDVKELLN